MKIVDAIAEILTREGVPFLAAYPTTPVIDAAAAMGIKPVLCRQERVGVGIADGFTRTTNGRPAGAFAMQYGPGAENAFAGVATAYSDSAPLLLLPLGHQRDRAQVFPLFSSARTYASVTKSVETLNQPEQVVEVMRRAFNALKNGRPGPVMVEIPADVAVAEVADAVPAGYRAVAAARAAGNPRDVEAAARALLQARRPIIHAGQGVLYAEASDELRQLAELLQAPVMTTIEGKSGFPEDHPLALGSGSGTMSRPVYEFLKNADLVFGVGCSFTKHGMATNIPAGKTIVHATSDERDLNKNYFADHPIVGDARLVLRQFIDAVRDLAGSAPRPPEGAVAAEIQRIRNEWLQEWMPKLTSDQVPITPYRIIWDFMRTIPSREAIVTHDSGSPREQIMPFYRAGAPRGYMGWGKSHALGTGLGLIMGAKVAAPDKFCVNFMGDAAFGMTGLDFETAVRCGIPITTIVLNNSAMAIERHALVVSHDKYRTRDIGGNYAELGRAMGGEAERIEKPADIVPALERARRLNETGRAVLLEFITSEEIEFSHRRAF